jgi:zinc/manganese transport system substrate-binding protein
LIIILILLQVSGGDPMRHWISTLAALALLLAAAGCGDDGNDAGDDLPLVVVTTTILGDLTTAVAGDAAEVEVLMPIGANPHAYEASARQAARMREADLIVANGIGLEGGLLDVIAESEADGVTVLRVGEALDPVPFVGADDHAHGQENEAGYEHEDEAGQEHEDEAGHDHEGGLDPHVWMDPIRMITAAGLIGEALEPILGSGAPERAAAYQEELRALSAEIQAVIDTIPAADRKLVTNHFAYGYYASRYGLEMIGTVIPAATTEAETSPAEFAALVALIEAEGVSAIFGSTTEPVELAGAIASEVGHEVEVIQLYTGSLGEAGSGAETYLDMMRASTDSIVDALTG